MKKILPSNQYIYGEIQDTSSKISYHVPNHSTIVEPSTNLKLLVDLTNNTCLSNKHQNISTYGVFHTYPVGIFNPAFTDMLIWVLQENHIMNKYKICQYHSITCGVIVYGSEVYVSTPISNGDISLHLKILLRGTTLKTTCHIIMH